jgi:hypothetical protein
MNGCAHRSLASGGRSRNFWLVSSTRNARVRPIEISSHGAHVALGHQPIGDFGLMLFSARPGCYPGGPS